MTESQNAERPALNLSIPGKMTGLELTYLARLAAAVPKDGVIVEVGPLYGRSTHTLAASAPHARVYSIDTWETAPWIERYRQTVPGILPFGVDAFRAYTHGCDNITPIKGMSPDVVADWSRPIDLYFEDATHGNPGLKRNLEFWVRHLKPGGILCGHDYGFRFPDVKREADALAALWGTRVEVIGSIWAIRVPKLGETDPVGVSEIIGPAPGPTLNVITRNRRRIATRHAPITWAGAHCEPDRLAWVALQWAQKAPGLDIEYRVGHPDMSDGEWIRSGHRSALTMTEGKPPPIWWFAARLTGVRAADYVVRYRTSYRQIGGGGHRLSGIGDWAANGDWATPLEPGAPATALCLLIQPREEDEWDS